MIGAAKTAWSAQAPLARGIILIIISTVAFASMHTAIRYVSDELHPFQIAFFRNVFGLAFLLPLLMRSGFSELKTKRPGLHLLRGVVNIGAMLLFFYALSITPLATVTALGFLGPIFAAALSVLFLGEVFRVRRWAAIGVGFLGMLIILRPGLIALDVGALMVIASAFLWGIAMMIIKILGRTESSVAITAWMGILLGLFSLGPAIWVWRDPTIAGWFWLVFIGFWGSIAQVTLAQALKEAEPTAIMPFDFLRLVWATLLAMWLFAESPDTFTWIGAAVIFGAGIYIMRRERAAARG